MAFELICQEKCAPSMDSAFFNRSIEAIRLHRHLMCYHFGSKINPRVHTKRKEIQYHIHTTKVQVRPPNTFYYVVHFFPDKFSTEAPGQNHRILTFFVDFIISFFHSILQICCWISYKIYASICFVQIV